MSSAIYWTLAEASQIPLDHKEAFLSDPEIQKFSSLRFPKRRGEWLLGRWAAKRLVQSLAPYQDYRLNEIEICNAPEGAPFILLPGGEIFPDSLTISHSGRFALCGLAPGANFRIGADIERLEPRSQAFIADYFTPAEHQLVASYPPEIRQTTVNLIWSAKESMLKALGVGLHWDTRQVEIREVDGLFLLASDLGKWQKMQLGDFEAKERRWAGWWQCRGNFVITLAGFTSAPVDLQSALLVEKGV